MASKQHTHLVPLFQASRMDPFEWKCSFCNRKQIATKFNCHAAYEQFFVGNSKYKSAGLEIIAVRCLGAECNEISLTVTLNESCLSGSNYVSGKEIYSWRLLPESFAKPQPEYIPNAIREDYYEACLIRDKSPKASATLSRRCLQGMIRDFCGISKNRLFDEINELNSLVEAGTAPKGVALETVEAIDSIRKVGNIGAHMEKDINLVVDVEAGEAQALIELIEMLFEEWYVARHSRGEKLARVRAIAAEKDTAIRLGRPPALLDGSSPSEG
jgi:Domain of unknown function (DUF4145)